MPEPERGDALPWERPLGARALPAGGVEFRVWAPRGETVAVRVRDQDVPMGEEGHGVHGVSVPSARPGDDYKFVLDGEPLPDPCSRWQPEGLRGPSRVVALTPPSEEFETPRLADLVLYELHIGTFTPDGTFAAAIDDLPRLAALGVGAIEIMPVAEFPGARGWGYDGVYISAAQSSYGGPQGLSELVSAAHEQGIAVILDVVYNHLGASGGGAIEAFGPYFTDRYDTPWGRAINFDDADCDPVREWVLQSAEGWIRDFGIDGLRLDAIHAIYDTGARPIVAELTSRVHAINPRALVIAESGMNDPKVMRGADRGGFGCDAAWADDYHHALRVLLTGYDEGYYAEFGRVADLAKVLHRPHLHDGTYSAFRHKRFGAPADDVPPERFVVFNQNHDQVGNRAYGDRLPPETRSLAALLTLLSPFTPMLFMGEEYGEDAPFQFFSDHIDEDIANATREGRRREFAAFKEFGKEIPDPQAVETFIASKLTRQEDPVTLELYRGLLAARRELGGAGEASEITFDEREGWLRFRRGDMEVVANLSRERAVRLSCQGREVTLSTHDTTPVDGHLELPPLSGALLR